MVRLILVFLLSILFAGPIQAESHAKPAITGVIQQQLDAFMAGDLEQAFTFASPNIKQLFGNAERFGLMVKNGFPMVWRPADVQFLELQDPGDAPRQIVMIRDQLGAVHFLEYQMLETAKGWQINGVQVLQPADVGV